MGGTTLTLTEKEINIIIPRSHLSKMHWGKLVEIVLKIAGMGLAWVVGPSTIAALPSTADKPAPRLRRMRIDALSYLLFVLLIPPNHRLRKLYQAIDWPKIDEMCAHVYENHQQGSPAYPPQVLFRVLVLMCYSGTPFESATLQQLETDVAWRWFVGLSLLCPVPHAGTLSYFRKRLGVELFEAILVKLIEWCHEAGLVGHLESYYDMTGVEASATQVTPYQRAVILAKAISLYLDQEAGGVGSISREHIAAIALEVLQEQHPSLKKVKPAQIAASQNKLAEKMGPREPNWWQRVAQKVQELGRQVRGAPPLTVEQVRAVARHLVPSLPQAFGNPDAAVGHTRTDGTLCGYRSGFLVDAKYRIITAVIFVALNVAEAPTLLTALDKHYEIFRRYPKRLGVDSAFDRDEVHQGAEQRHIESVATARSRPGPKGVFHADAFIWNELGQLICPNGEVMEQVGGPSQDGPDRYRSSAECARCPLFKQCLTAKQQLQENPRRELKTNTAAHQRAQQNRKRSRSDEGWGLRLRRFAAEGLFGHLNRYHNGDKAPYRNKPMDHIAQLMVAFTSNLEQLAAHA
jgi:transposase